MAVDSSGLPFAEKTLEDKEYSVAEASGSIQWQYTVVVFPSLKKLWRTKSIQWQWPVAVASRSIQWQYSVPVYSCGLPFAEKTLEDKEYSVAVASCSIQWQYTVVVFPSLKKLLSTKSIQYSVAVFSSGLTFAEKASEDKEYSVAVASPSIQWQYSVAVYSSGLPFAEKASEHEEYSIFSGSIR